MDVHNYKNKTNDAYTWGGGNIMKGYTKHLASPLTKRG